MNDNEKNKTTISLFTDEVLDSDDDKPYTCTSSEENAYYDAVFSNIDNSPTFTSVWDYWGYNEDSSSDDTMTQDFDFSTEEY